MTEDLIQIAITTNIRPERRPQGLVWFIAQDAHPTRPYTGGRLGETKVPTFRAESIERMFVLIAHDIREARHEASRPTDTPENAHGA